MASVYATILTSHGEIKIHRKFAELLDKNHMYINVGKSSPTINIQGTPKVYVGSLRAVYSRCMANELNGRMIMGFRNGDKLDYRLSNLVLE